MIPKKTYLTSRGTKCTTRTTRQKIGGGVSIFILKSFSSSNELTNVEINDCNYLAVEINKLKTVIITAYRPPSSDIPLFLKTLDELLEKNQKSLFFGDTNIDLFDQRNNQVKNLKETFHNIETKTVKEKRNTNTRNADNFFIERFESRYGFADFYAGGLIMFNELDERIKKFHTLRIFKTRVKEHLYSQFLTMNAQI